MIVRHEVQLDDKVTPAAKTAAASVQGLASSMSSLPTALGNTSSSAKSFGDSMAKNAFNASNAMQIGQQVIGGAIEGIKGALTSLASGDVQGAIESLGDGIAGAAKALDLLVPGLGEVASALIKVQFAALGLVAAGAKMAIEASQAKQQMIDMFDALGEGAISGEKVDDMLDGLRDKLGQTKDSMVPLVKQFMAMGITSQDALERMTTAALSAKALMGGSDAAAQSFTKLAKKIQTAAETGQALKIPLKGLGSLADMGLTVDDVAKKMGIDAKKLGEQLKSGSVDAKKFGDALQDALIDKGAGPLQRMSGGIANLGKLAQEYIGDLFEDMGKDIEPFLAALKDLFGILDSKSKPSGQALKFGIESFFKNVFQLAAKAVPIVKHFLLDVIIYGLKAYIALKPILSWFKSLKENQTVMTVLTAAFNGLKFAFVAIAVVIGVVLAVLFALWAISVGIGIAIFSLAAIIFDFVTDAGKALIEWASSAYDVASDFISGLVSGITNGAQAVISAVTGVVGGAITAAKKTLGIASPSKVMGALGENSSDSFADSMSAGAPTVAAAAGNMAGAAITGASGAGAPSGNASAGSGPQITVYVQIDGAGKSAQQITEEMVATAWERIALEGGL